MFVTVLLHLICFLFVMLLLMLRANNQKHVFCYAKAKRIGNKFQGI